jgi:hypothetical protein
VGDDVTDESVFAVMPALGGFGYSVGRKVAGVAGTFDGPQDVRDWLTGLCDRGRDVSICSSRAQAGDQMALELEDVPDRDGFSCFSGVVGGLQEAHDLRRPSPASNGPAVEGRSTRRLALPK